MGGVRRRKRRNDVIIFLMEKMRDAQQDGLIGKVFAMPS